MSDEKNIFFDSKKEKDEIKELCLSLDEKTLTKWALEISKHAFEITKVNNEKLTFVIEGYLVCEMWLDNKAKIRDIRRVFFAIQKFALLYNRNCLDQLLVKCAAQAVSTPAVIGHSLVCSDFAIKAISKYSSGDEYLVKKERIYQLNLLKQLKKKIE